MNDHDSYLSNMLDYERWMARADYKQALTSIDLAISSCSDGYALTTITTLRAQVAEKVQKGATSRFAAWLQGRGKKVAV